MKKIILLVVLISLSLIVFFTENTYKTDNISLETNGWKPINSGIIHKIEIKRKNLKNVFILENDIWRMIEPISSDLNREAVKNLLEGIENLTLESLISSQKEKRKIFEVDESGTEITIYDQKHNKLESFIMGKPAPDFNHIYFRKQDSDDVYWSKGLKRHHFDNDTRLWRDRSISKIIKSDINKIKLRSKDGVYVFQKENEDWFIKEPEERKVDKNRIDKILNTLSNFQANDFEDKKGLKETSLTEPELEITVESINGDIERILIGKEAGRNIYVKNAEKDQIFLVMKNRIDSIR